MNLSKQRWENIYSSKKNNEVSWWQEIPKTSLNFIHSFNLPKSASIIDIGGGDSKLVDFLLDEGYENVTVLDISSKALEMAKCRLGEKAEKVKWITSDVTDFQPRIKYDLWRLADGKFADFPGIFFIRVIISATGSSKCPDLPLLMPLPIDSCIFSI